MTEFNRFSMACRMWFISAVLVVIGYGIIQLGAHNERKYLRKREALQRMVWSREDEVKKVKYDDDRKYGFAEFQLEEEIKSAKKELETAKGYVITAKNKLKRINDEAKSHVFPTPLDVEEKKKAEAQLDAELKNEKKVQDVVNDAISRLNALKKEHAEKLNGKLDKLTIEINNFNKELNKLDGLHTPEETYLFCSCAFCFLPAFIIQLLFWFHIAKSLDIVATAIIDAKCHLEKIMVE